MLDSKEIKSKSGLDFVDNNNFASVKNNVQNSPEMVLDPAIETDDIPF